MPLDKSRAYGTIYGEHFAAHSQNGKWYNAEGLEVNNGGQVIETGPGVDMSKNAPPVQRHPTANPPPIDPDDEIEGEGDIDLRAYAEGKVTAPWPQVVAQIQRTFDVVVKNKAEAVALITKKLKL